MAVKVTSVILSPRKLHCFPIYLAMKLMEPDDICPWMLSFKPPFLASSRGSFFFFCHDDLRLLIFRPKARHDSAWEYAEWHIALRGFPIWNCLLFHALTVAFSYACSHSRWEFSRGQNIEVNVFLSLSMIHSKLTVLQLGSQFMHCWSFTWVFWTLVLLPACGLRGSFNTTKTDLSSPASHVEKLLYFTRVAWISFPVQISEKFSHAEHFKIEVLRGEHALCGLRHGKCGADCEPCIVFSPCLLSISVKFHFNLNFVVKLILQGKIKHGYMWTWLQCTAAIKLDSLS